MNDQWEPYKISEGLLRTVARKYAASAAESLRMAESGGNLEQTILYSTLYDAIKEAETHMIRACDRAEEIAKQAVSTSSMVSWPTGNLLDMWDGMANDTKDLIHETETGFYNAVESLRPR